MTLLSAPLRQSDSGGFALGDFWSLTQQAGPLRWPIFFVLAFGLVQVFVKLYELIRDRSVSQALYATDYGRASLDEITRLVSGQEESMLSSLQSTMLNVFHTRPGEGLLHDEITNFVAFQQDQFSVFRRRMEFLSDTAGALGLMGTVWGMFTVFFQGTAQQDVILRGMGIALITTLLGLVVSIVLNFAATELSSFFSKRLEQVSMKSDELRFRLMELAPKAVPADGPPPESPPEAKPTAVPAAKERPSGEAEHESSAGVAPRSEEKPKRGWCYVDLEDGAPEVDAGQPVAGLALIVRDGEGRPVGDMPVVVSINGSGGSLEDGARRVVTRSDDEGRVEIACTAPERVGAFSLHADLPDQPGPPTRIDVKVRAGVPHRVDLEGNNQAAVAGMRLPMPLGVRVFDRFGNPVPGVQIRFQVRQGTGKLAAGKEEHRMPTDGTGLAATPFVVSSEAGQNIVSATIGDSKESLDFVAFGTGV
jgi:biopolymer transport protein ExbB/TolQ